MRYTSSLGVRLALGLVLGLLLTGCRKTSAPAEEPAGPPWFRDATGELGLNFVHDAGPVGRYFMPQVMGSGAALFDYDNDGRLDIYLIQNGGPGSKSTNRLFHQRRDGKFVDVTEGSGLGVTGYGMGVAIGDVNNDGYPDVLLTEFGRIRLFLNNRNGTFTDVTREAGLDNPHWGTSACFVDFDRDGWLDLVVANYVVYSQTRPCSDHGGKRGFCGPSVFPGTVAKLYHNLGRVPGSRRREVRFEDVTVRSGLGSLSGPGLGVACADFNGDHWPDIFIANDGQPNHLWVNQHDGTFKEEAVVRGVAYNAMGHAEANMGIALGDLDGNGLFDIFVTHLTEERHVLWKQESRGLFADRTAASGLASAHYRGTGFGTVMGDFDQDGAPDLAVANGRVKLGAWANRAPGGSFWQPYRERNQLFANEGGGQFRDISPQNEAFCGRRGVARGLACGDIDGDGALDLLVTEVAGPARILCNAVPNRGHWLMVRATDPLLGGRDAYGAEVTVHVGQRRYWRLINPGLSYLCSSDPRAHFGLGAADRVDAIEVVWPDGTQETFGGRAADRVVTLRRGQGKK
jgi:hypothetical protein